MAAIKTLCILLMDLGLQIIVVESSDPPFGYIVEKGNEGAAVKSITKDIVSLFRALDAGDVKIWEVKEWRVIVTGHPAFNSDRCYVIKERPSKKFDLYVRIWFWVGKSATVETASNAAAFAVELAYQNDAGNRIRREVEEYESIAFRILGLYNPKELESSKCVSIAAQTTFREKRMFVIDKKGGPSLREVVVSSEIFEEEDTEICVVLITQKVYVRCGRDAPTWARRGAESLADIMTVRNGIGRSDIVILKTDMCEDDLPYPQRLETEEFFDQIPDEETVNERQIEFMDDLDEFTEEELRRILPQTMVWNRKDGNFGPVGLKISEGAQDTISEQPLSLKDVLDPSDCCIIDNYDDVNGLYVWMGPKSKLALRQAAARRAEKYLRDKELRIETSIAFVDGEDIPEQIRYPELGGSSEMKE